MIKLVALVSGACLASASAAPDYQRDVRPILEAHCMQCHGPDKQKADIRFDTLATDFLNDRVAAEIWHDAANQIKRGEMPPAKKNAKPLNREQRAILTGWIDTEHERALAAIRKTQGGPTTSGPVMRRLNRYEYQYTMQDLLGFDMDYVGDLPEDARSPEGYRNDGAVLGMSALQIEQYLGSARRAMELILVEGDKPEAGVTPVPINRKEKDGNFIRWPKKPFDRLGRTDHWLGKYPGPEIPRTGRFTVRVKAKVVDWTDDWPAPVLQVETGYFVGGAKNNFLEPIEKQSIDHRESRVYEFSAHAEFCLKPDHTVNPKSSIGVIRMSNVLGDGNPPPKQEKVVIHFTNPKGEKKVRSAKDHPEDPKFPKIVIEDVELVRNDYPNWPPPAHRRILHAADDLNNPESRKDVLRRFLRRAWRRPVTDGEMTRWTRHWTEVRAKVGSDLEALRETLAAALGSMNFLYLREPGQANRALNDYEVASRLSYLLWSSMPDADLLAAAEAGRLRDHDELKRQLHRMLADEKSERFVRHFTSQWLNLDGVKRVAINPKVFKDFDESIKVHLQGETRAFFGELLRSNEPAIRLLDADFTMLNGPLAKYYGFRGDRSPRSQQFQRVPFADMGAAARPGGVLGHGVVHLVGSDGADSHPVKRAVWIRERLLHDPPKPPPPDVPDLSKSAGDTSKLSIREQLAIHRKKPACADCHDRLDPWGIALENFSPLGMYRTQSRKTRKKVSAETMLPGNHAVSGIEELKQYLLKHRKDQFADGLVANLMTYALGRPMRFDDDAMLKELAEIAAKHEYRLRPLMEQIVTSKAFLSR